MKIGLVRHFEVKISTPKSCDSDTFNKVCRLYDTCDIIPFPTKFSTLDYSICYCSPLKRAYETAHIIYDGEIIVCPDLVEVPMQAPFQTKKNLRFGLWKVLSRVGWAFNLKKMPETRKQTDQRMERIVEIIKKNNSKNILLVTHGFFITCLQSKLKKMGFKGKETLNPSNGTIYEFVNN